MNIIRKFVASEGIIPPEKRMGELPSTRETYRTTAEMAMPAVADTVLVALVSLVDTMMVSTLGTEAIAAVGLTTQPRMLILCTFLALNVGITAVVARRRGQNDAEGACRALGQAVTLVFLLSVLLAVCGAWGARSLMLFMGAQSDTVELATEYFHILMVGIPFNILALSINAAQRGCGNTKISMQVNMAANLVNIVFNYLLIGGNFGFPALGVRGAALATSIGNVVGFVMALCSIFSKKETFLHLRPEYLGRIQPRVISPILSVGSSAMVEQIFMRFGFMMYAKICASLGTQDLAAHNIGQSILTVSFSFCDGLGISAASLTGQSLGRGRPDLSELYVSACQRISLIFSSMLIFVFLVFGSQIIGCFTSVPYIINKGVQLLYIMAMTVAIQSAQFVYANGLRGAGDTKFSAFVSMICIGIVRPGFAYLMCYPLGFGLVGAWSSYFLDQVLRAALYYTRFKAGKWKKIVL